MKVLAFAVEGNNAQMNITPPPPTKLVFSDWHFRHSAPFLSSLLLAFFLSFSLVACNSGGGGSSSPTPNGGDKSDDVSGDGGDNGSGGDGSVDGDKTPELVDNADISFSSVDITADTVIGMREFLFTLTYNNLTDKKELNFIVGETSTPPTWDTVKAHVTKITRAFDGNSLKTRRIYFSATEKLTGISIDATTGDATMSGAVVDLSQDGKTESEITKADAPGIMVPASNYYIFVYDDVGGLVKQQDVETASYPDKSSDFTKQLGGSGRGFYDVSADMGQYIWGMDGWKNDATYDIVKDVEVKQGEVFFLPSRIRSPSDWDLASNDYCTSLDSKKLLWRKSIGTAAPYPLTTFTQTGVDSTANLFSFTKSPELFQKSQTILEASETDETFDLMYLAQVGAGGNKVSYDLFLICLTPIFLPVPIDHYSNPSFTLITE